jgi:hypothetical protein
MRSVICGAGGALNRMDRFKSDVLKISAEYITSFDVSAEFLDFGEYSACYTSDAATRFQIQCYGEAMKDGTWLHAFQLLHEYNTPEAWACAPLVFLRDGTLYEGKHRMAALATITESVIYQFIVITGWHDGLPMPCGWMTGWADGVDAVWWKFREMQYNAVRALVANAGRTTLLEGII